MALPFDRTLRDRWASLADVTRSDVFQVLPPVSGVGEPSQAKTLNQILLDQIQYPAAALTGNSYAITGSLLEFKYDIPLYDGYASKRFCRVWVDGSGIASRHQSTTRTPVARRSVLNYDQEVTKRLRVGIPMRGGGAGAAKPSEASDHLARIVTNWEDASGCSWTPLFERLWAGFYAAQFGATAVGAPNIMLDALWPESAVMAAALFDLRVDETGLSKILIRQRKHVTPYNPAVFHVLTAVTQDHLGFAADTRRGGRYPAGCSPYLSMAPLLIVGKDKRPDNYPATFSTALVGDADSWRLAIHWLLEQGLPQEDCVSGLVMAMRHSIHFLPPFVTHFATPLPNRLVGVAAVVDVLIYRVAMMRYCSPIIYLSSQGPDVHATLMASGLTADNIRALPTPASWPVVRTADRQWCEWAHGMPCDRTAAVGMLAQCSTQVLLALCEWAADEQWASFWPGGVAGFADAVLDPPMGMSREDFLADIRAGGIINRAGSLPLFNVAEDHTGLQCSGLSALYTDGVVSERLLAAGDNNGFAGTLRNTTCAQIMHAIMITACMCRAATDLAAECLGLTAFNLNMADGLADTGDAVSDHILNFSDGVGLPDGREAFVHLLLSGIDSIMALKGLGSALFADYSEGHTYFTYQFVRGAWAHHRYTLAKVLHPVMGQHLLPEMLVSGGTLHRKFVWLPKLAEASVPVHEGFKYDGTITKLEMLGCVQVAAWLQFRGLGMSPVFCSGNPLRGVPTQERALHWGYENMLLRDSDAFPGVPTMCVSPLWFTDMGVSVRWVITNELPMYARGLYYLGHEVGSAPAVSGHLVRGGLGFLSHDVGPYAVGHAAYVTNNCKDALIRPPGLRSGARGGWCALLGELRPATGLIVHSMLSETSTRLRKVIDSVARGRCLFANPGRALRYSGAAFLDVVGMRITHGLLPVAASTLLTYFGAEGAGAVHPRTGPPVAGSPTKKARVGADPQVSSTGGQVPGQPGPDPSVNDELVALSVASVEEAEAQIARLQAFLAKSKAS